MASRSLSIRVREEFLALIDSPRHLLETLSDKVEQTAERSGTAFHATLLNLLAHLEMGEEEAARHWKAILAGREELTKQLGRDPGLRIAAVDYFLNREPCLVQPKIVRRMLFEKTENSSVNDGLTGLFTRHHVISSLRKEIHRAERKGGEFSLVLMDLDRFRQVNERCGRRVGDTALKEVAGMIQVRVRDIDFAGRYAGEEFILFLPRTRRLGAFVAADRIRASVCEHFRHAPCERERLHLTLSAGVAAFPADGATGEDLIERATRALSRAKACGGDRVVLYHEEKRRFLRFKPLVNGLRVEGGPTGEGRPEEFRIRDLSEGGGLFVSARGFRSGEDLEVGLSGAKLRVQLTLRSRVVRSRRQRGDQGGSGHEVGVRFLTDRPDEREGLEALLANLRSQGIE